MVEAILEVSQEAAVTDATTNHQEKEKKRDPQRILFLFLFEKQERKGLTFLLRRKELNSID